jgi:uncharacterized protein
MSAEWAYLDSSAVVKLVNPEMESEALERYLREWPSRTSSALLRVEVLRAAQTHGPDRIAAAYERLNGIEFVAIDTPILEAAGNLKPVSLRSLDAIHLATAREVGEDLGVLVTYDHRLAVAATELGLPVASPS